MADSESETEAEVESDSFRCRRLLFAGRRMLMRSRNRFRGSVQRQGREQEQRQVQ